MTKPIVQNPFTFGFPLKGGDSFIGRRKILEQIFNDLVTARFGAKVSIFGARNIGTTSLLLSIASPDIQRKYSEYDFSNWHFPVLDLKEIGKFTKHSLSEQTLDLLSATLNMDFKRSSNPSKDLKSAADTIDSQNYKVVILLDEVDRLVEMGKEASFMDVFFYNILNRGGNNLNMITASKRPLYELFANSEYMPDITSPFFVHFKPVRVGLFSPAETKQLVLSLSNETG